MLFIKRSLDRRKAKKIPKPEMKFLLDFNQWRNRKKSNHLSLRGAPASGRQVATKPYPERSEGTLEIATRYTLATTPSDCFAALAMTT
jgi:hypothetical protein